MLMIRWFLQNNCPSGKEGAVWRGCGYEGRRQSTRVSTIKAMATHLVQRASLASADFALFLDRKDSLAPAMAPRPECFPDCPLPRMIRCILARFMGFCKCFSYGLGFHLGRLLLGLCPNPPKGAASGLRHLLEKVDENAALVTTLSGASLPPRPGSLPRWDVIGRWSRRRRFVPPGRPHSFWPRRGRTRHRRSRSGWPGDSP